MWNLLDVFIPYNARLDLLISDMQREEAAKLVRIQQEQCRNPECWCHDAPREHVPEAEK